MLVGGRRPLLTEANEQLSLTIVELHVAYRRYAEVYYRKHGQITNEVAALVAAAKVVNSLYGRETVTDFGPLKLQAVQQASGATSTT